MLLDFTSWAAASVRPSAPAARPEATGAVIGRAGDERAATWPVPSKDRASHALVMAGSGVGKTILVALALIRELLAGKNRPANEQESLFVVDPKGDLVAALLEGLSAEAPDRLRDVRYLDPFSRGGFPYNLTQLDLGTASLELRALQLAGLISSVSTGVGSQGVGLGSRQVDLIQHAILGALSTPQPSNLLLALDALLLPDGLQRLAGITGSARARQYLTSVKLNEELRQSTASRLRLVLSATVASERMFAASGCIQFADLLAPGRICLVDLGRPTGGLGALQTFFANCLCRLAIEHLLERPSPWTGNHVRLIFDEAQIVAPSLADPAELLLTTGRSRGLSLTVLTQGTTLLDAASTTLLPVLLSNTPTKLIGRLNAPDAERLSRELSAHGTDERLADVRARFVSIVTNLRDKEWIQLLPGRRERFTSEAVDLPRWRAASQTRADELERVKLRLALPDALADRPSLDTLAPASGTAPPSPARRRPTSAPAVPVVQPQAPHLTVVPTSKWG